MLGWSLIGPFLLCGTLFFVELRRCKSRGPIDFLTAVNAVYFICFVVTPVFLRWVADAGRVPLLWRAVLVIDQDSPLFILSGLVVWLSYLFLAWGYFSGSAWIAAPAQVTRSGLISWGCVLLVGGGFSIAFYASQIGGLRFLLETVLLYRAQAEPVYTQFTFLKTFSVVATGSTVLILGGLLERPTQRLPLFFLLAASVIVSLLVLIAGGGRLAVIQYLLIFPLYFIVRDRAVPLRTVAFCIVVFLAITTFGHGLFDLFNSPGRLESEVASVGLDPAAAVISVLIEFSFPWVNVASALSWAGSDLALRWFLDVPLAIAWLLPKRLLGLELPPTIGMEHEVLIGHPFPPDLLSFGIYSAYVPGAFLVAWFFGRIVRALENYVPASGSPAWLVLRAAWLAYIGSRVMYGNPHHTLTSALPLLIATVVMLVEPARLFRRFNTTVASPR